MSAAAWPAPPNNHVADRGQKELVSILFNVHKEEIETWGVDFFISRNLRLMICCAFP